MKGSQVVMFPGLGAQYPGMMEKYLVAHPEDLPQLQQWRALMHEQARDQHPDSPLARERNRQFEIHALNLLWWRREGARYSDAVRCGHSLGAYAALVASGALEEALSFRLVNTVLETTWPRFVDNAKIVFVVTTRVDMKFDELVAGLDVEILAENNERQSVLYAERAARQQVLERLGENLLNAVELGNSVPFHSREMLVIKDALDAALAPFRNAFRQPRAPLCSHISGRWLTSDAEAFDLIALQPYERVRWTRLVDRLIQAGRTDFIEVGPNRILSQIVRWISPHLTVQFVDHLRR